MDIKVTGNALTQAEINEYVKRAHELYPGVPIETLTLCADEDSIDITYDFKPVKFERIRRITGYLVGTLDRFNNAKRAEEHDRVKHSLGNT